MDAIDSTMKRALLLFALTASALITTALLLLKLFTTEVFYPGEDTIGLALRSRPSVERWEYYQTGYRYMFLSGPDHSYLSQQFYPLLMSPVCILGAAMATAILFILLALHQGEGRLASSSAPAPGHPYRAPPEDVSVNGRAKRVSDADRVVQRVSCLST